MAERAARSPLHTLLWITATLLLWPLWLWLVQAALTYPATRVARLAAESGAASPSRAVVSLAEIGALVVVGLAFGFLGVYVLRRCGAPRIVWVPAAAVSMFSYLAVAMFWAGSSGSRTGLASLSESLAAPPGLGIAMAMGAWLAARDWRGLAASVWGRRREHTADEFGQSPATGGMVGFDPPLVGAASVITLDGVVERESGATPPPPPFSMRSAAIGLGVMFALGGVALILARCFDPGVGGG